MDFKDFSLSLFPILESLCIFAPQLDSNEYGRKIQGGIARKEMKLHSHEEMLDTVIGQKGTAARNDFEARLKAEIEAYQIGEAIKQTRLQQNLTQKQLGERMGVQEAQISKIESGKSITFSTIIRAFKALGANKASLDLGSLGRVALW